MAEEQVTAVKKRPSRVALVAAAVLGLGGGATLGVLVVGPLVAPRLAQAGPPSGEDEATGATGARVASPGETDTGTRPPAGALFQVENFVVNPAGTEGTRFLMLSMAVEVPDAGVSELMRGREAEIRDTMVRVVGRRTVRELADVARREELTADLKEALEALFGAGSVGRLFLPQFVIQ